MTASRDRRSRKALPVVFYAHPFEIAVALMLLVSGIRTALDDSALDAIAGELVTDAWVTITIAGAGAMLLGLGGRERALGRAVERFGLYLVVASSSAYALAIGTLLPISHTWDDVLQLVVLALAGVCRSRAIVRTERVILRTFQQANRDPVALRRLVDGRPPVDEERP